MLTVTTFQATVYCGLRRAYSEDIHSANEARELVQAYVDRVGLCVTFTLTDFIYSKGSEPGLIIGLINYPRFPSDPNTIYTHAVEIAKLLLAACGQQKVSIVTPSWTYMLTKDELEDTAVPLSVERIYR